MLLEISNEEAEVLFQILSQYTSTESVPSPPALAAVRMILERLQQEGARLQLHWALDSVHPDASNGA
jgi:hypothetical protein